MSAIRAVSVCSMKGSSPAQEDHVLVVEDKGIFVMADGFGGPAPGAEASRAACEAVRNFLIKEAGDLDATLPFELRSYFSLAGNVLFNGLIHANKKVLALNKSRNVHEKGGASVLAGYLDGDLLALANVGGCTAWLIRDGRIVELVAPRTYARLRDPFATDSDPKLRAPLMAVGISKDLEPEIFEYRVKRGDWLLLHTEGVTEATRHAVVEVQGESLPAEASAQRVLSVLNESRIDGNSSVSLIVI